MKSFNRPCPIILVAQLEFRLKYGSIGIGFLLNGLLHELASSSIFFFVRNYLLRHKSTAVGARVRERVTSLLTSANSELKTFWK